MKKHLNFVMGVMLCLASVLFFSCTIEENKKPEWEGTKLIVQKWPDNVEKVQLGFLNSPTYLILYDAGQREATEYFTGEARLIIEYPYISIDSEANEYFGYGTRTDSEKPFKVYINGVEAENENPQAVYHENDTGDDLDLNANINHFITTFNLTKSGETVKSIEVTFENSPEKIRNKDIRLTDETIYAYVNIDDLFDRFDSVSVWNYNSNLKNLVEFHKLARGGVYYFHRYTPEIYLQVSAKKSHYISDTDFELNVGAELSPFGQSTEQTCTIKCTFTTTKPDKVPAGSVVTITGGTVTQYDISNFVNKTLVFAKGDIYENIDPVTQSTLEIKDNETFVLNLDRHEYTGTWQALKRDTASYEIELELSSETGVGEDYKFKTIQLEYWKDGMNDINEPCWQLTSRLWYYNPDEVKQAYHCSFYMTEKKN